MRIAAAAYPLDFHDNWEAYATKQRNWIAEAAAGGAQLLVFPEYGAMELASLGGAEAALDLQQSLRVVSDHAPAAARLHDALAREFGVNILAGSGPVFDDARRPVNRTGLYGPRGALGFQDKQVMTRFEREEFDMCPGSGLKLFEIGEFIAGIPICYDSEFPLFARALAEAGANLILTPSCTETLAGYSRVRIGAMARALENQCVAVHAPLVGECHWCPAVHAGTGAAAIYGPPDKGFPATGIIAEGTMNKPGWIMADVSPAQVEEVRRDGEVLNFAHWTEQYDRIKKATFPANLRDNT